MLLDLLRCLLLVPFVTFGLAWPLAGRLALDPAEKICATAVLSLFGVYLFAFAVFVLGLPAVAFWTLPLLSAAGLIAGRRALRATLADSDVRALLLGQLLIAAWSVGWLTLVVFYSGGGWVGDWYEHWGRTEFFIRHWPLETRFLRQYLLPARPPLANLVTGALIAPVSVTFANYQLVTTLLNSLVFLPAALLARRFASRANAARTVGGAGAVIAVFTVLLMLNPSFVENATFAWTKLFAACFILGGIYFFLRTHDAGAPSRVCALSCAACLGAGFLAHYSAGPYIVVLAIAWFALNFHRRRDPAFWRLTFLCGLVGGIILATWFSWSLANYGLAATVSSNSSAAVQPEWRDHPALKIALNLRDTMAPHFLHLDPALFAQGNPGYLRDWMFLLYQVNLFFIFGSIAWLALLARAVRDFRIASGRQRGFWSLFTVGVVVLGVAVHGGRDVWGLAHICLQSGVVLGLAYLAARWSQLGRRWQIVLAAGGTVDLVLGIGLQFAMEGDSLDRWLAPNLSTADRIAAYTETAKSGLFGKLGNHLSFVSDVAGLPLGVTVAFLGGVLAVAVGRAWTRTNIEH